MSTRLFIVRHAEHVGPEDTRLSKFGSLQAAALGETFKRLKTKFDAIYSSSRCKETAEAIAAALGMKFKIDERLRQWDGGVTKGLTKEEVRDRLPEVYNRRFIAREPTFVVPEGESLEQRYRRVEEFLADVTNQGPSPSAEPRKIIVVTHGGIIDDMFRLACRLSLPEKTNLNKPYGCVSALLHENGHWRDEHWARADHLPKVVAESPQGGHLYIFPMQVSGSFPMLRGDRGELCKPATSNELACYTAIYADPPLSEGIARLKECVPTFLGTVDVDIANFLGAGSSNQQGASSLPAPSSPKEGEGGIAAVLGLDDDSVTLGGNNVDGLSAPAEGRATIATVVSSTEPLRRTSSASSLLETGSTNTQATAGTGNVPTKRRSFSVVNLWNRFVTDRWQKLVRASDSSSRCVYLILEDVTFGLINPNIMDVKVGTRQHRDSETLEKQKRKAARCKDSTSASLGIRIHGISMFDRQENKTAKYDKYWGRSLDDNGVFQALKEFIDTPTADVKYVVSEICKRLNEIRTCVMGVTWRFYGSSILIVFDPHAKRPKVAVRLIDLGSCEMNASTAAVMGESTYDEGFVFGLDNLIRGLESGLEQLAQERQLPLLSDAESEEGKA